MRWKKHQRHPRQKVYLVRNMSGSNSCYTYKKTIYDIGTEILKFQCLNCFKTPLFCKSIIPEDSKISRRDLSFASVKSRFKAILKKWNFRLSTKFIEFVDWVRNKHKQINENLMKNALNMNLKDEMRKERPFSASEEEKLQD